MILYFVASLFPGMLLGIAALQGGAWSYAALLGGMPVAVLLDRSGLRAPAQRRAPGAVRLLTRVLGAGHLALMPLLMQALAQQPTGPGLALFLAAGLYLGQVGNSNAHELIHMPDRWARRLGAAVYTGLLFGHHASAHLLVHHVHVASPADPNSARPGEGFYRFWPRAWIGSFMSGLKAVNRLRARGGGPARFWTHPYLWYGAGAGLSLAAAAGLGGAKGALVWWLLCLYTQMQLMLADYVQHYGLRRADLPDGRLESVSDRHSWNAGQVWTAAMMLNAPRHSDHHAHPSRSFPELRLTPETMPTLPASLPVMAVVAMVPPLWRRIMDPRAAEWRRRRPDGFA